MRVSVVHQVFNVSEFLESAKAALAKGIPDGYELITSNAATDGSKLFCVWEAPSVAAAQEFLDPILAKFSKNEYTEVVDVRALL